MSDTPTLKSKQDEADMSISKDGEQSSKDGEQSSKDGKQSSKDGEQSSKDGEQSGKDGEQSSKDGEQSSKDGEQSGKDGQEQTVVDLTPYIEPNDSAPQVITFAIEKNQRNTGDNPDREGTHTMPWLVRRVDSQELLPRPFKTTNQLICASYLSLLCCCLISVWAVKSAWKTKIRRNKGIYNSAARKGKQTCYWMIFSLVLGIILWIIGAVFLIIEFA